MTPHQTSRYWQRRLEKDHKPPHPARLSAWKRPAYQLLLWVERQSYGQAITALPAYPHVWRAGRALALQMKWRHNDREVWRQVMVASTLVQHWEQHGYPVSGVNIGDGYGFLTALLAKLSPSTRWWSIDLPPMLDLQRETFERTQTKAGLLAPVDAEQLPSGIECAVNVCSMQEMTPKNVEYYFDLIRRRSTSRSHFYCVNRLIKDMGEDGVRRFQEYPWQAQDQIFFDGACAYFTHSLQWRPLRVKFYQSIWHRMVRLAPDS